jgi:hypothetical protein
MKQVAVALAAFVCGVFLTLTIHPSIASTPSEISGSGNRLLPPRPHATYSE